MLEHLTLTKAKRSAVVYKMHGDREHPDKAILTVTIQHLNLHTRSAHANSGAE